MAQHNGHILKVLWAKSANQYQVLADELSRKRWLKDAGYTTSRRLREYEPDELKVSLKSDSFKSGIL